MPLSAFTTRRFSRTTYLHPTITSSQKQFTRNAVIISIRRLLLLPNPDICSLHQDARVLEVLAEAQPEPQSGG